MRILTGLIAIMEVTTDSRMQMIDTFPRAHSSATLLRDGRCSCPPNAAAL